MSVGAADGSFGGIQLVDGTGIRLEHTGRCVQQVDDVQTDRNTGRNRLMQPCIYIRGVTSDHDFDGDKGVCRIIVEVTVNQIVAILVVAHVCGGHFEPFKDRACPEVGIGQL